jgi:hypothetical protein
VNETKAEKAGRDRSEGEDDRDGSWREYRGS